MSVGRFKSATERMMDELTNTKQRHQELFGAQLPPATARSVLQDALDSVDKMNPISSEVNAIQNLSEKPQGSLSAVEKAASDISNSAVDEILGSGAKHIARQLALENYGIPLSRISVAAADRARSLPPHRKTPNHTIKRAADIGTLIRTARNAMGMTQTDFAAHAGVGRRFVSELESGKPSLEFDKVMACAEAAGIDLLARSRNNT